MKDESQELIPVGKPSVIRRLVRNVRSYICPVGYPYRYYDLKHNCIFIHIPKVAGTSILKALGKEESDGRQHVPWYIYNQANPKCFSQAFKFSFVRNPWDRAYSSYQYLKSFEHEATSVINSFEDFDDFIINGLGQGIMRNHLLMLPQSEFILSPSGTLAIDFLGRYETLAQDFSSVAERLRLPRTLSVQNKTINRLDDYKLAYKSEDSVRIVGEVYKQDILTFGYAFE